MKKLLIETYGCQMNVADSEVIASILKMAGYDPCEDLDEADAILLNTCSVRQNAENKIIKHQADGTMGCRHLFSFGQPGQCAVRYSFGL